MLTQLWQTCQSRVGFPYDTKGALVVTRAGKVAEAGKPAANMDYYTDYDRRRRAAGLTDGQVCEQAGVANSTVTRARHDQTGMTRRTYTLLVEAINTLARKRAALMARAGITLERQRA